MKKNQILNYILILIGSIVAIYAQNDEQQNVLILVLGIVVLMSGIYRIARQIPSKFDSDDDNHINRDDESI
jgi:uncharacterized membrane protein HdeD (DUF308 family)